MATVSAAFTLKVCENAPSSPTTLVFTASDVCEPSARSPTMDTVATFAKPWPTTVTAVPFGPDGGESTMKDGATVSGVRACAPRP